MPKNKPRPLKGEHQPEIIVRATQNIGPLPHTESAARAEGSSSALPLMRQHARKISVGAPQRDLEVMEVFFEIASGRPTIHVDKVLRKRGNASFPSRLAV